LRHRAISTRQKSPISILSENWYNIPCNVLKIICFYNKLWSYRKVGLNDNTITAFEKQLEHLCTINDIYRNCKFVRLSARKISSAENQVGGKDKQTSGSCCALGSWSVNHWGLEYTEVHRSTQINADYGQFVVKICIYLCTSVYKMNSRSQINHPPVSLWVQPRDQRHCAWLATGARTTQHQQE